MLTLRVCAKAHKGQKREKTNRGRPDDQKTLNERWTSTEKSKLNIYIADKDMRLIHFDHATFL